MKRIYLAAVLIVAAGAGIGLLLRPAPSAVAQDEARQDGKDAKDAKTPVYDRSYSGPTLHDFLPPSLNVAAANRADCFYMRVAFANASSNGDVTRSTLLRKQGADAGCWMN